MRSHSWMRFVPSAGSVHDDRDLGEPVGVDVGSSERLASAGAGERAADGVRLPVAVQVDREDLRCSAPRGAAAGVAHLRGDRRRVHRAVAVEVGLDRAHVAHREPQAEVDRRDDRRRGRRCRRSGDVGFTGTAGCPSRFERLVQVGETADRAGDHHDRQRPGADATRRVTSCAAAVDPFEDVRGVGRLGRALQLVRQAVIQARHDRSPPRRARRARQPRRHARGTTTSSRCPRAVRACRRSRPRSIPGSTAGP